MKNNNTTKHYLRILRKELSPLGYLKKKEIITEIQNSIDEKKLSYEEVIERFGPPKDLAASYLKGVPTRAPAKVIAWKITRGIFAWIGLFSLLFFLFIFYFISKNGPDDKFDYSQTNLQDLNNKVDYWREMDISNEIEIDINQSNVIVYWDDNANNLRYSCKGKDNNTEIMQPIKIEQKLCYLIVPNEKIKFKTNQSGLILIKPKNNIEVNAMQTIIRFDADQQNYHYQINQRQSTSEDFEELRKSDPNSEIKISIQMFQSKMIDYQFED